MGFGTEKKTICNNISVFLLCSFLCKKAAFIFLLHILLISCSDIPLVKLFKLINCLYFYLYKCRQVFCCCCSLGKLLKDSEDNDPQANSHGTQLNLLQ